MFKLLVALFLLVLSLSGCNENNGKDWSKEKGNQNFYIIIESYEELEEYMNDYLNTESYIPNVTIDAVTDIKYLLRGTCMCREVTREEETHEGNHSIKCPNFHLSSLNIYCYIDENKCFELGISKKLKETNIKKDIIYEDKNSGSSSVNYIGSYGEVTIFMYGSQNDNCSEYELSVEGIFTKEEAEYWYNLVYEVLENYDND